MNRIGTSRLHYNIIEKLGEGGMGVVYKALDTRLEREVAIKFLPLAIAANPEMRTRFEIEARAAANLNHPNIATVYAIEELEGPDGKEEIFFVMEFIDGLELKQRIRNGEISLAEVVDISLQVAEGLHAAHEKGIIHRDIKPANIMLTAKGRVKLMDFGLARIGEGEQLTKSSTTFGTVAYMSPEQAQGTGVDHRTDIWSFGVVLYEMLAGSRPFQSDRDHAMLYAIVNNEPAPLLARRPDVPKPLIEIIDHALKKDPQERYQDIRSLIEDLQRCGDELSASTSGEPGDNDELDPEATVFRREPAPSTEISSDLPPSSPHQVSKENERKTILRYSLLGLFFFLVAIGGLWWIFSRNDIPQPSRAEVPVTLDSTGTSGSIANSVDLADPETSDNQSAQNVTSEPAPVSEETFTDTPGELSSLDDSLTPPLEEDNTSEEGADQLAMRQQAMRERLLTDEAEARIPGNDAFKKGLPSYASARQTHLDAQAKLDAANYENASELLIRARKDYDEARNEAIAQFKLQADDTRVRIDELKAQFHETPDIAEYREALSNEEEGIQAYGDENFEEAARLYLEAELLFNETTNLISREAEILKQVEAVSNDVKRRLRESFESRDIEMLAAVVALSAEDRDAWESFFGADIKNIGLQFDDESLQPLSNDRYQLDLASQLTYTNNKNNKLATACSFSGSLDTAGDNWSSSKFTMDCQ